MSLNFSKGNSYKKVGYRCQVWFIEESKSPAKMGTPLIFHMETSIERELLSHRAWKILALLLLHDLLLGYSKLKLTLYVVRYFLFISFVIWGKLIDSIVICNMSNVYPFVHGSTITVSEVMKHCRYCARIACKFYLITWQSQSRTLGQKFVPRWSVAQHLVLTILTLYGHILWRHRHVIFHIPGRVWVPVVYHVNSNQQCKLSSNVIVCLVPVSNILVKITINNKTATIL